MCPKPHNKKRKPGQAPRKWFTLSVRIGWPLKKDLERFSKELAQELDLDKPFPTSAAVRYLAIHALRALGICKPKAHELDLPWEAPDARRRIIEERDRAAEAAELASQDSGDEV